VTQVPPAKLMIATYKARGPKKKGSRVAKVDILIPCYNYGRFLRQCVDSVLDQSMSDIRVLIIDDASSDDSHAVAQSLSDADPRVSFISHAKNMGHIKTYNEGIDWLEADYFLLLSADDLLVPGALERASRIMDEHPDIVLTHGRANDWFDNTPLPTPTDTGDKGWRRQDLIKEMCENGRNLVATPTAIVRTCVQKRIGGYLPDLPHSADMAMWLQFAALGSVAEIHTVQANYRQHSSNMSIAYYAQKLADYRQRKAAFDSFFWRVQGSLADGEALQAKANRKLAEQAYWTAIGQLVRGRKSNAVDLLRFATGLSPRLYYFPPFQQLLRTPNLDRVLASIAGEAASRFLGVSKNRQVRAAPLLRVDRE
jgi:glycosyltransferase involved in cell wall biosynthesis